MIIFGSLLKLAVGDWAKAKVGLSLKLNRQMKLSWSTSLMHTVFSHFSQSLNWLILVSLGLSKSYIIFNICVGDLDKPNLGFVIDPYIVECSSLFLLMTQPVQIMVTSKFVKKNILLLLPRKSVEIPDTFCMNKNNDQKSRILSIKQK